MCELHTYLASCKGVQLPTNALCLGLLITIPLRIVLHVYIIKFKGLLIVRRIVSWQILRMDKCVCVAFILH